MTCRCTLACIICTGQQGFSQIYFHLSFGHPILILETWIFEILLYCIGKIRHWTPHRVTKGSGILEKFRNSTVLFSRPWKVGNLSLGWKKLSLIRNKLHFLCLRASFMRSAIVPCHRQSRLYSKCWLVDSRPFHLWWPMKLCLTNPWSISFKDGGNLVLLSSGDDFWKQLLLLFFLKHSWWINNV